MTVKTDVVFQETEIEQILYSRKTCYIITFLHAVKHTSRNYCSKAIKIVETNEGHMHCLWLKDLGILYRFTKNAIMKYIENEGMALHMYVK